MAKLGGGMLVRCGRCRRVLCRAVAAVAPEQRVVLVDVRPYARYTADPGPAPSRRVHLACHRRCGARYTRRLDYWPAVSAFAGRRESATLGVDA